MNVKVDSQSTKEYDKVSVEVNYQKEEKRESETHIDVKASNEKNENIETKKSVEGICQVDNNTTNEDCGNVKTVDTQSAEQDITLKWNEYINPKKNKFFGVGIAMVLVSYVILLGTILLVLMIQTKSQTVTFQGLLASLKISGILFGIIYVFLCALASAANGKFICLPMSKVKRKPVENETGAEKAFDYLVFIATTVAVTEFTKKIVEYISSINVVENDFFVSADSVLFVGTMLSIFMLSFSMMINQIIGFLELIAKFIPNNKESSNDEGSKGK